MSSSKTHKTSGFTIVEVAVGATVMIIVGFAVSGLQYIINQNQVLVFDNSIKVELANANVSTMVRELRTSRDGDNGAYAIESASNQSITFYSDVDYDGKAEKVRYFLQGQQLMKGIIKASGYPVIYPADTEKIRAVADNVRNGTLPIFYYYNANWPTQTSGNPMATPADPDIIKLIRVSLRLNTKADSPQTDYVLESFANLRTLKQNL